ncbi:MAG: RNA polymerase sigma factor [Ktedonobacteraceae bacterium]
MEMSSKIDEIDLVDRTIQGDQDAFRTLVLLYETPLLAYIYGILNDWENARDVAQETFVAAYYALPRWIPPTSISKIREGNTSSTGRSSLETHLLAPWLYQIATNRAITFLKKHPANKHTLSLDDSSPGIQDIAISAQIGDKNALEEQFIARELLHIALSHLSEEDALCLVLRFVLGERYTEIAERVGSTKEAVRKRIARGLVALRSAYIALETEVS